MDVLRRVELLICAAEAGSFAKAARFQNLDPSAISHAIAELEAHLGVRLFHRTTRKLVLTEEGATAIRHGRAMLEQLAGLQSVGTQRQDSIAGTLRIGLSVSVSRTLVMPQLAAFLRAHPKLQLECSMVSQLKDLHAAGLDLMFHARGGADVNLVSRRLFALKLGVYAAPAYLAHAGELRDPAELLNHTCLVHKPSFSTKGWDEWEFHRGSERRKLKVRSALVTDDREGLLEAAVAGSGVVRVGMLNPALLAERRLTRLLPDWTCPGGPAIHIAYRKGARTVPKVAAFLDFLKGVVQSFDSDEQSVVH
jgi:DNA-binding transcriptional LysR family regulator